MPTTWPAALTSGPPRVARVDGGVGLDEVVERLVVLGLDRSVSGRDDPGGDARVAAQVEGVADGDHVVADLEVVGGSELGGREVRDAVGLDERRRRRRAPCRPPWPTTERPSEKSTSIVRAPSITWLFVRIMPSALTTMPEPAAWPLVTPVWMDTTLGRTFPSSALMSSFEPGMVAEDRAGVVTDVACVVTDESLSFHRAATEIPPATMAPTSPPIRAARMPPLTSGPSVGGGGRGGPGRSGERGLRTGTAREGRARPGWSGQPDTGVGRRNDPRRRAGARSGPRGRGRRGTAGGRRSQRRGGRGSRGRSG